MKDSLCSSRLGVNVKITTLSQETIYVKRLNDGCQVTEEWASAIMDAKVLKGLSSQGVTKLVGSRHIYCKTA
jgi:hypothetical protein